MKQWEPGIGQAYTAHSLEEARECMKFGFEKHLEVFGVEANAVKVGPGFKWPEIINDEILLVERGIMENLLIVCRVEEDG